METKLKTENTNNNQSYGITKRYLIVFSPLYLLKSKWPLYTLAMRIMYFYILAKNVFRKKAKIVFKRKKKKFEFSGKLDYFEIPSSSTELKPEIEDSSVVMTEIVFHDGDDAIEVMADLVEKNLLTEEEFKRAIADKNVGVREETEYIKGGDGIISIYVSGACSPIVGEVMDRFEKVLKKEEK